MGNSSFVPLCHMLKSTELSQAIVVTPPVAYPIVVRPISVHRPRFYAHVPSFPGAKPRTIGWTSWYERCWTPHPTSWTPFDPPTQQRAPTPTYALLRPAQVAVHSLSREASSPFPLSRSMAAFHTCINPCNHVKWSPCTALVKVRWHHFV